jgi:pyruvate kinase
VILATQVLESMTTGARPTRAEASDAANAVEDGVDAIMLSGETAAGVNPAHVVQTLDAIIRDAESAGVVHRLAAQAGDPRDHAQAICEAAVTLAEKGDAQAIVAITRHGGTARRLSALRPRVPILATTDRPEQARRLSLCWGVSPMIVNLGEDVEAVGAQTARLLLARGLVPPGTTIVLVRINADLTRTDANYLKIHRL